MVKYASLIGFVLIVSLGVSNESRIDSLRNSLLLNEDEIDMMRVYTALSLEYLYKDVDSAQYFIAKSIQVQHESKADSLSPYHLNVQGMVSYVAGDKNASREWWTLALDSARHYETNRTEVQILNNLSVWETRYGHIDSAMYFHKNALATAKGMDNPQLEYNLLNTLGNSYLEQSELDSALTYFILARNRLNEGLNLSNALAINNIGVVYTHLTEFAKASSYYREALSVAEEHHDHRVKQLAMYNLMDLYFSIGRIEQGKELLLSLEEEYTKSKNAKGLREIQIQRVRAYTLSDEHNEALESALTTIAQNGSLSNRNLQVLYDYALVNVVKLGDIDKAEELVENAIPALELNKESVEYMHLLAAIANTYWFIESPRASAYFAELERQINELDNKVELSRKRDAYYALYTFNKENRVENARLLAYLEKADSLSEAYHKSQLDNAYQKNLIEHEVFRKDAAIKLEQEKLEKAELQLLLERKGKMTIALVSVFTIAFMIFVFILRNNVLKKKEQLLSSKLETERLNSENQSLRNKQLSTELEIKKKEALHQAMQLIQKNNLIAEYLEVLERIEQEPQSDSTLVSLRSSLERVHNLRKKEWDVFNKSFESVNQDFYNKILKEAPDLTPRELQLCALIKLNLTVKELSQLLNITIDGVKKARHRIRKKMGIDDPKDSLTKQLLLY